MIVNSSNKPIVQLLVESCYKKGVRHIVISPGSRNAPLTISFSNNQLFTCYSIPDERSAAFYALGMAKQLNEPVAIICTSGSALLNYAPAIAEAYYQEIPLVVITADRPPEWIDQEDGQTIRQIDIYKNYIGYSTALPKGNNVNELAEAKFKIEKAFMVALANQKTPIHINIPFEEPLYEMVKIEFNADSITKDENSNDKNSTFDNLIQAWNSSQKILIIAGVMNPDAKLSSIIQNLIATKNAVVIAPPYSNLNCVNSISLPELIFNTLSLEQKEQIKPDLIISIGGPVVSKATKLYLREFKACQHFDIDFNETRIDTYLILSDKIISSPSKVFSYVNLNGNAKSENYLNQFLAFQKDRYKKLQDMLATSEFCDFRAFGKIVESLNNETDVHFANSTPIRYAELFLKNRIVNYYCNRGTSGIDGNTSIAAGAALISKKPTLLITGDISFGYDSNAFWNNHVPNNLKVIVINNGGGNIFRIISGPDKTDSLAYFETPIQKSIEHFCLTFNIGYMAAKNDDELTTNLNKLMSNEKCTVLEVFTPNELSAKNYKLLFQQLRK